MIEGKTYSHCTLSREELCEQIASLNRLKLSHGATCLGGYNTRVK